MRLIKLLLPAREHIADENLVGEHALPHVLTMLVF
jgi:hypothetical protein